MRRRRQQQGQATHNGTQTIPGSGRGDRRSSSGSGAGHNEDLLRITKSGVELMNDPQEPLIVVR
jgi:hypothetical protein